MRRLLSAVAIPAAAVLLLAGCGGDDTSTDSSASSAASDTSAASSAAGGSSAAAGESGMSSDTGASDTAASDAGESSVSEPVDTSAGAGADESDSSESADSAAGSDSTGSSDRADSAEGSTDTAAGDDAGASGGGSIGIHQVITAAAMDRLPEAAGDWKKQDGATGTFAEYELDDQYMTVAFTDGSPYQAMAENITQQQTEVGAGMCGTTDSEANLVCYLETEDGVLNISADGTKSELDDLVVFANALTQELGTA